MHDKPKTKPQFGFGADGNEHMSTTKIVTLTTQSDRHSRPSSRATADYISKRQSLPYGGFGYICCFDQLSGIPCGERPATDVCSGCCARRLLRRPHTSSKHARIVQPVGKLALQVTYRSVSRLCLPRPSQGCLTAGGLPSTSASDLANAFVNVLPSRTFCSGVGGEASNSAQTGRVFPHN